MSGVLSGLIGAFAPVASSFESIATLSGTGVSSVTFSSIPSTYKSLQIRALCTDAGFDPLLMQFNGDTATNYASHEVRGVSNGTVGAVGIATQPHMSISGQSSGLSGNALYLSGVIIDVQDYISTTKNKTVRGFSGFDTNGNGNSIITLNSGLWISTAVVTSITLKMAGNYSTGSTFALYGIKG